MDYESRVDFEPLFNLLSMLDVSVNGYNMQASRVKKRQGKSKTSG